MTREEAIKTLVRAQRGLIATALSEYEHKMIEALEMALSALRGPTREQAEKMRGSMTNREAALKSCKDRLEHLEKAPSHHCGKRQRQRAIELEKVKIEALRPITREQVERVWRGEWIDCSNGWMCSRCEHDNTYAKPFCPNCGAPMTDEGVDMVMERLEALRDE